MLICITRNIIIARIRSTVCRPICRDGTSIELKWINDEGINTVPEWIARLREQLSRTYSAMGCKAESDYNRNVYLDILDYTRQDKELESRFLALEKETDS